VPLSAILGESRIMDALTPGSMGSTHGGNALCARVALENIDVILEEHLSENAARIGDVMLRRFQELQRRFASIGDVRGLGLVFGLEMVKDRETREPDADLTKRIIDAAYQRGLLLIAPIGFYGNVLRIAPPLVITEDEANAGIDLLAEAIAEAAG
jgi:4-aminobutyrate aminotransferase/(S)-3-amino-2-methylpropionate transaminase